MKKILFVGLGNVGARFAETRHNVGAQALRLWQEQSSVSVDCLFPTTFMNDTGPAAAAYMHEHGFSPSDIVVIHDEVELPLGEVQVIQGGSAKGHNGVRSLHAALVTQDFKRVRLGVGRPPEGLAMSDFVLQTFLPEEDEAVKAMLQKTSEVLTGLAV